MKTIKNPENGAAIKGFIYNKRQYSLPVGEMLFCKEDGLAEAMLNTFGFLQEVREEGKFVCSYGDFASDVKVAVIGHEKIHAKPEPEAPEFVTPEEQLKKVGRPMFDTDGIPTAAGPDKDGIEWYGEGLQVDNEVGVPA